MPSTYTNLLYHIIFSTKERRPFINAKLRYAAFTVSKSQCPTVRKYIANQEQHHRKKEFKRELVSLLEKNDIDYDERYLWD